MGLEYTQNHILRVLTAWRHAEDWINLPLRDWQFVLPRAVQNTGNSNNRASHNGTTNNDNKLRE